jgi:hypothetical protein
MLTMAEVTAAITVKITLAELVAFTELPAFVASHNTEVILTEASSILGPLYLICANA